MKIKPDENVTTKLSSVLSELGHDVRTAIDEGLSGKSDFEVWRTAQTEDRFLITQDLDFSDVRVYAPGSHAGTMLLRLDSPNQTAIVERVREVFAETDSSSWRGCLVIASATKVRVIRPT